MRCIADFEAISEISIPDDVGKLKITHPNGDYVVYLKNGAKSDDPDYIFLRMQIEFYEETLELAKDTAIDRIVEVLNFLSLTTSSRFEFHRMLNVFDWTPNLTMRRGYIFAPENMTGNAQPFLSQEHMKTIETFLLSTPRNVIFDAMRWFRLGVSSMSAEEQFQNFWFALEIVAEDQKRPDKVFDSCPKCGERLYCEACGEHPRHRPYPKQAIEQLVAEIAPDIPDLFQHFSTVRNALLHGGRLKEIEERLPYPNGEVVNLLGRVAWKALLTALGRSLPSEVLPFQPTLGMANAFVRMRVGASALVETIVPNGEVGKPDIEKLTGIKIEIQRD